MINRIVYLINFVVKKEGSTFLGVNSLMAGRQQGLYSSTAIWSSLSLTTLVVILWLELHAARSFHHRLRHSDSLLSIASQCLLCHLEESLLDTGAIDGACLIKEHVIVFVGPLLASLCGHRAISLLVKLISDADEGEWLRILRPSVLVEAISPSAKCFEWCLVRDVIAEGAAVSSTIKGVSEWLELLLAGGIPDLQRHNSVVY